eukprot:5079293-Prymnesium_polylepis.1
MQGVVARRDQAQAQAAASRVCDATHACVRVDVVATADRDVDVGMLPKAIVLSDRKAWRTVYCSVLGVNVRTVEDVKREARTNVRCDLVPWLGQLGRLVTKAAAAIGHRKLDILAQRLLGNFEDVVSAC